MGGGGSLDHMAGPLDHMAGPGPLTGDVSSSGGSG